MAKKNNRNNTLKLYLNSNKKVQNQPFSSSFKEG